MKKILSFILAAVLVLALAACGTATTPSSDGSGTSDANASQTELAPHTIGVLVYNFGDDEVVAFRKYLMEYIGPAFNVTFLYSGNITSQEEEMEYIQQAIDNGAEGIMSFISQDLEAEVELCAQNEVYYLLASGTVSDEEFAKVEKNEYFLGAFGPGTFIEYKAGADMANHFASRKGSNEYFILSGGASLGNAMHQQRTQGMLDTLQTAYGVSFEQSSEEMALTDVPLELEAGELKICICPGYISRDEMFETIKAEYIKHQYENVLSSLAISRMAEIVKGAKIGVVDCYSETNLQLFNNGTLDYISGKYSSIIGPSFAAMYNAITGYGQELRTSGNAFHIAQGFWSSENAEDYEEKYVLASSMEMNAYNYEDLQQVINVFNPDATLDDLKELAGAYTFKDAVERRAK